jgi:glycosyltransferase involved in cell wall biosynthesis
VGAARSMSKRILIISHMAGLCGAERSLLLMLQHMDKNRFEPLVALARRGPLEQVLCDLGIRTWNIWCPWWVRIESDKQGLLRRVWQESKATFRLCNLIRRENVDLVYTNCSVVFSGALSAFLTRRPHVWHIREILQNNPDLASVLPCRLLFGFVRAFSRVVVVNSVATGRQLAGLHKPSRFHVIYNAQPQCDCQASIQPLNLEGVTPDDWLVSVVGTLQRGKAPDDAIRALAVARRAIPRIRLLLVGDGSPEFKTHLLDLCSSLGISDRVIFTGFRTDVASILSHSHVLVMPSRNDSFGRVLIEAMAVGIPVIGVDAGGISEVVEDGVTGFLVAPGAPEELAMRLIHIYQNPDLAKAMGAAGRYAVATRFNVDTYVRSLEQIFEEGPNSAR